MKRTTLLQLCLQYKLNVDIHLPLYDAWNRQVDADFPTPVWQEKYLSHIFKTLRQFSSDSCCLSSILSSHSRLVDLLDNWKQAGKVDIDQFKINFLECDSKTAKPIKKKLKGKKTHILKWIPM